MLLLSVVSSNLSMWKSFVEQEPIFLEVCPSLSEIIREDFHQWVRSINIDPTFWTVSRLSLLSFSINRLGFYVWIWIFIVPYVICWTLCWLVAFDEDCSSFWHFVGYRLLCLVSDCKIACSVLYLTAKSIVYIDGLLKLGTLQFWRGIEQSCPRNPFTQFVLVSTICQFCWCDF